MNPSEKVTTLLDPELVHVLNECRRVATASRNVHPEMTAALVNYRAAQMIAGRLDELIETVRHIETNITTK